MYYHRVLQLMSHIQGCNEIRSLIFRSQIAKDWFSEGEKTNWKTKMHVLIDAFTQEVMRETTNVPIQTPLCSSQ